MIIRGDCIEEMKKLEENSIDAIITDPPYGIGFMGKEWDNFKPEQIAEEIKKNLGSGSKEVRGRNDTSPAWVSARYDRSLSGNQKFQIWFSEVAKECLRVIKPGGFLLSFGGTRTYHRMACGIEDAGFEIRDCIMWLYGSGFPKSLNIGKQIDKTTGRRNNSAIKLKNRLNQLREGKGYSRTDMNGLCEFEASNFFRTDNHLIDVFPKGEKWIKIKEVLGDSEEIERELQLMFEEAEREVIGKKESACFNSEEKDRHTIGASKNVEVNITIPETKEAKEWEGWGTALKPACEPIVVARKPLSEKNVALNVLKWGTGGINIDACRIGTEENLKREAMGFESIQRKNAEHGYRPENYLEGTNKIISGGEGRFPANIIFDEEAGEILDEQSGISKSPKTYKRKSDGLNKEIYGKGMGELSGKESLNFEDKGGASRFFYVAKASKSERNSGMEEKQTVKQFEEKKTDDGREVVSDRPHQRGATNRKNNHPTVKPIKLMEYLIKLISKEKSIVLDPFTGSGTTGIACAKLNRQFIGFEKEEEYVKIAEARIKPYLEQKKL